MFYIDRTHSNAGDAPDAAYSFALEEYLLHKVELESPVIMLWQTQPCVMIGQYQIAQAEVCMPSAQQQGITIVRRPSGGGAIFTDGGTFLLSMILPAHLTQGGKVDRYPQKHAWETFAGLLTTVLGELDIPAKPVGRNDILVDGKKISGKAQHVHKGRTCTHASLLFDANLDLLAEVLKVDDEKFRTKAVKSIRSRVTNIKDYAAQHELPIKDYVPDQFAQALKGALIDITGAKELKLGTADKKQVAQIYREKYGNPEWTLRKAPPFTQQATKRFPAGRLDIYLEVSKGIVRACSIHGDFLGTAPMQELEACFIGQPYTREAFTQVLEKVNKKQDTLILDEADSKLFTEISHPHNLSAYLGEITAKELINCIFD